MLTRLFRQEGFDFDRTHPAPIEVVWRAWTEPEMLRQWWGPHKTTVPECEIDLRIGGRIHIVMEATAEMGKYEGTRWPMTGTFTTIEPNARLAYDVRSWTEGQESTSTVHHVNDVVMTNADGATRVTATVAIEEVGSAAKMAAFGMKWGYKAQLDKLERLLA